MSKKINPQEKPDNLNETSFSEPVVKKEFGYEHDFDAINAKVESLSACVADLQRQLREAPTAAVGRCPKPNRGKQIELGRLVHAAYVRCVEEDEITFNLSGSMVKDNSHVRDKIIEYCKESSYFDRYLLKCKTGFTSRGKSIVEGVILSFFNNMKAKIRSDRDPLAVRQERMKGKKVKERRSRKLSRRLAMFKRHPESAPSVAAQGDCDKVLVGECQSDEEDGSNDDGSLDCLVPAWRSETLNNFFQNLDNLHDKVATRKWGQKPRNNSVVDKALPPDLERDLPTWSKAV
ncbi:uncharacterized protein EV154DRAFT_554995 [Mucor mucedo]|uniref:uncharacterized protein n=1 Tax=Mucor mucedo TaxID=29922 RepID=UPI00221EA106|nr:uncharacterized protein EV154DRAFT_554995 [Mucor mucedo]KAI7883857.1 hypothetical protein EV154DRAFT_554995 [Mucor mucedo]